MNEVEVRAAALQAAVKFMEGRGGNTSTLLITAAQFEKYLRSGAR